MDDERAPLSPATALLCASLDELSARLVSRPRAIALRRFLYQDQPPPQALPGRVPGVSPRAWSRALPGFTWPSWRVVGRAIAADGTRKLAIAFDGDVIESVLIPGARRSTVCVSSQVGCTRRCAFCATAALGFKRQLSAAEILMQYLIVKAEAPQDAPARNVVFMGMGEPLDNLAQVLIAVERLTENPCPGLSCEHVTVATSGVLPAMQTFLRAARCRFALSLNATTDDVRARLMPHAAAAPIADLLAVLRERAAASPGERFFITYVLWAGVNDSPADAERLIALLKELPAHINLIPHNPLPGGDYRPPPRETILRFAEQVQSAGVRCLVRPQRGAEIAAACGQLARSCVSMA